MIYVIFGASGTGKTTLLNCVFEMYGQESIHRKGTTRAKRQYDDIEIESFIDGLPEERFSPPNGYIYSSYGYEYGIEKSQLDNALKSNIPHFVICNDIETIKLLRQDYANKVIVIYLQFDAPREIILEIQKRRHITDDEINLRISKIDYMKEQFAHNSDLFDTSLLNRYGDNPEITLRRDVDSMISRYETSGYRVIPTKDIIFATIDHLTDLIRETEQKNNATYCKQVDKGFLFIIMPMMKNVDKEVKDGIQLTYLTIKETAREYGFRAARVDNISSNSSIDIKIFECIEKAEIIVADLTYERPNCYFELGYARALGKDVIIISKKGTYIHFDLQHYSRIEYEEYEDLARGLVTELNRRRNDLDSDITEN